ncbi:hypothetical protein FX985_05912 [Pseudomonas extremaustralis]|uniref:Uncharacterized protein n=1 Tax=Pseudomonas extremaustralis TaxID=359110 RepID=A0A5M9IRZ8_9PSED|nr:hypothetical protein FX985_05912 [Pseudomonas extremaustralis]
MHLWLTHCYRGQAPSHSLICIHQVGLSWLLLCFCSLGDGVVLGVLGKKCGRGLAPDGACQLVHLWLTHSYRGQAPSHIWICIHQADLGLLLPWLFVALEPTGFVSDVLGKNVGGGLPPMGECQLVHLWLTHSYRGQAPSHIWICIHQADLGLLLPWLFVALEPTGFVSDVLGKNVGGGLPPMGECQLMHLWLTHSYRGQAPSHSLICIHQADLSWLLLCFCSLGDGVVLGVLGKKCGRGLAPDGGVSVGASVADPQPSGVSPLPHLDLRTSGRPGSELKTNLKRHYLYE